MYLTRIILSAFYVVLLTPGLGKTMDSLCNNVSDMIFLECHENIDHVNAWCAQSHCPYHLLEGNRDKRLDDPSV